MKISASKKTTIILNLCLIFLLLSIIFLLYKDVISNGIKHGRWFSLGKYDRLLEDCKREDSGGRMLIKCKALIKETKRNKLQEDCYEMVIISDNENNLVDYSFCERASRIDFSNPYSVSQPEEEFLLPVYLTVSIKSRKTGRHKLESVNITYIPEEELTAWLSTNQRLQREIDVLGKPLLSNMTYNYLAFRKKLLFPDVPVNSIRIYNLQLKNRRREGDSFELEFTGSFARGKQPYKLLLKTKGFTFLDSNIFNYKGRYVDMKEEPELLKLNNDYDIDIVYAAEDLSRYKKQILETCTLKDGLSTERKVLCNIIEQGGTVAPIPAIQEEHDFLTFISNHNQKEVLEGIIITNIQDLNLDEYIPPNEI